MSSVFFAKALPWLCIALGTILFATFLRLAIINVKLHKRIVLLSAAILSWLPSLYVGLVWTGLLPDRWVRLERPVAVLIGAIAGSFVAYRLAGLSDRQSAVRRYLVESLGMVATLCASLALAGIDIGKPLDRLTILLLIDRSRSVDLVPSAQDRIKVELLAAESSMRDDDRIGTIVFGATAAAEDPPRLKSELPPPQKIEVGRDGTDIGAAIRRALAEVPPDSAARMVIISDGVSNRGDAIAGAAAAIAAGVPIDVVALDQKQVPDVRVVAVRMPTRANEGETLELRLVTASSSPADIEVRLKRDGQLIAKANAKVSEGEDVLRIREKAPEAGLHRYDVEITALNPSLDQAAEDNAGSAFVRVRGPASALVLDGEPGKSAFIAKALRDANFMVTEGSVGAVPDDLGGFARYDVIFWSDIPAPSVSPGQLEALSTFVRDLGGGLVLMGGDKSMGPGGYSKTPVEDISPVSFDIKQEKRRASLAEVIIIDYSGSMSASAGKNSKLELANEAAARSASLLGPGDRLGVAHVDTAVSWSVKLGPVLDPTAIAKAIRAVKCGGGGIYTDIALQAGYAALDKETVNLKHLLLFADGGDAEQLPGCRTLVSNAKRRGITTSVVSLGKGSDTPELEVLSKLGDGRFYLIEDANRLPAVFAQETILASRSAIHEIDFRVSLGANAAPTRGIDFSGAPILRGYVVTIPKDRTTTLLAGPEGDPILATWSAGMGRSAAFTSDLKDRWGSRWTTWPGASTLVAQLARDVTRMADDPRIRIEADAVGGELHIRAEAVGEDGRAQSFRRLTAHVGGPDGYGKDIPLDAVGAGAYAATLPLSRPGTYVVTGRDEMKNENIGTTGAVLTAGEEMRPTGSDRALLGRLASMSGGKVRDTLAGVFHDRATLRFAYRNINAWLAAIAALTMLAGVASRRLAIPEAVASFPGKVFSSFKRKKVAPVPAEPAFTAEVVAKIKERARTELGQNSPLPTPAQHRPAPMARQVTSTPQPDAPPASLRSSAIAASVPGGRQLTAAEILLQRRRGRQ